MRRPVALVAAALLTGCGAVESFRDTARQTRQLSDALQESLGTRPEIAWQIHNGDLTRLSVRFEQGAIPDIPLSELSDNVRDAVALGLDEQPRELVISVRLERP